jgi:hypothetical protein
LHTGTETVAVVFRFDDGQRQARLQKQHVVGRLRSLSRVQPAAHHDLAGRDDVLLAHLVLTRIPAGADDGRGDVPSANLGFFQSLLVDRTHDVTGFTAVSILAGDIVFREDPPFVSSALG